MHQDFVDLLRALVDDDVRFMVVGAYALVTVGVIGLAEFIRNKRATLRAKDIGDISQKIHRAQSFVSTGIRREFALVASIIPQILKVSTHRN
jgi:hypothetical protein